MFTTSLNEGQMKQIILGALLVGTMAGQGAYAEIRTFDFTANVSSLASASNPLATSVEGIQSGTTVALGDVIKGTLSFDDLGTDWSAATGFSGFNNAISFSYTFESSNTTVDITPALWSHTAGAAGATDLFNVVGANAAKTVGANLLLFTPGDAFSWELGNGTSAALAVTWRGAGSAPISLNANLSSLVEVTPVPEPSTYGMMLLGVAVLAGVARANKRRARSAA
jgi:hypothetical protein